jgi:hypothetical protein
MVVCWMVVVSFPREARAALDLWVRRAFLDRKACSSVRSLRGVKVGVLSEKVRSSLWRGSKMEARSAPCGFCFLWDRVCVCVC